MGRAFWRALEELGNVRDLHPVNQHTVHSKQLVALNNIGSLCMSPGHFRGDLTARLPMLTHAHRG